MIIDVHTHAPRYRDRVPPEVRGAANTKWSPGKAVPMAYTWEEFQTALAPVDRAIVFNIAADPEHRYDIDEPYIVPTPAVNDETAAFVHAYPEKYIGFVTVHPHDPGALEEIERGTQELGFKGVKLGLNYQNVNPLGPEAFRIYDYAQAHGLPILFHQGTSPVRFADIDSAHPRHTDRIAMAFPELKIIMAHIGHPWQVDALVVARKHPNVWADVSGSVLRPWGHWNAMRMATEWGVLDKLLFGSDFPASTPEETMARLRAVNDPIRGTSLPPVPEDKIEEIIHRDSLALLGLT
jgi:predicted TIM-barrel fold metal-dependent hydrolase